MANSCSGVIGQGQRMKKKLQQFGHKVLDIKGFVDGWGFHHPQVASKGHETITLELERAMARQGCETPKP